MNIEQALRSALQHHQSGRLREAEQLYRRILVADASHPDALNSLGLLRLQDGKHDEAVELIRRAIAGKSDFPFYHNNLGEALRALGRYEEAAGAYRQAISLKPDLFEAHNNLGIVLQKTGEFDAALACYERCLALNSNSGEAALNYATVLARIGRFEEAERSYRQALRLQPNLYGAYLGLASLLEQRGDADGALAAYESALQINPRRADVRLRLAMLLQHLRRFAQAIAAFEAALKLDARLPRAQYHFGLLLREMGHLEPARLAFGAAAAQAPDDPDAHNDLGTVLWSLHRNDEAMTEFEQAVRLDPQHAGALANLGNALAAQGRLDEAMERRVRSLEAAPDLATAYFAVAEHGQQAFTNAQLGRMEALIGRSATTTRDKALLELARANHFRHAKDYDTAFEHFQRANHHKKEEFRERGVAFDPAEHARFVDRMIATCDREFFTRTSGWGIDNELPVFVIGMPRSATTLTEQILASHPDVHGAGELPDLFAISQSLPRILGTSQPYPECLADCTQEIIGAIARRHLDRLERLAGGSKRVVDKLPINFLHLGLIAVLFPNARLVHTRRDARDVCLSCYLQNFTSPELAFACDLGHLGAYYRQYERLMAHWESVLPAPVRTIEYERLVSDLEPTSRSLIDFCGLEWDDACLAFHETQRAVLTASYVQVRRPIYQSSLHRWKRYEKHLGPLFDALSTCSDGTHAATGTGDQRPTTNDQ